MFPRTVFLFCISLLFLQHAFCKEPYSVQREKSCIIIEKGGKPLHRIDIKEKINKGERSASLAWPELRPISPDGKTIPLFIEGNSTTGALLLIDTETGKSQRHDLFNDIYMFYPEKIRWLTTYSLVVSAPLSYGSHIFHNIITGKTVALFEEAFPSWDTQSENYVSIFGKSRWFGGRQGPVASEDKVTTGGRCISEVVRYNSYCVYPVPVKSFQTYKEYDAWLRMVAADKPGEIPASPLRLRETGVYLPSRHEFSRPDFVGQTPWAGFFEMAFPLGNASDMSEFNAVLLDAHAVKSDPPSPQDISVRKASIPPFKSLTGSQYMDFVINLEARWNGDTSFMPVLGDVKVLPEALARTAERLRLHF
jgi:hypothetical protein